MIFYGNNKPKNICYGNQMLFKSLVGKKNFLESVSPEGSALQNYLVLSGFWNVTTSSDSKILDRCNMLDPAIKSVLVLEGGGTATTKYGCNFFIFGSETWGYANYEVQVREYDTRNIVFRMTFKGGNLDAYNGSGTHLKNLWVGATRAFAISVQKTYIDLFCVDRDTDYDSVTMSYTRNKPVYFVFTGIKPDSDNVSRDDIYIYLANSQTYYRQINS